MGHEHASLSWTGRAGTYDATPGLAWPARLPDPVMDWSGLASHLASQLASRLIAWQARPIEVWTSLNKQLVWQVAGWLSLAGQSS